MMRRLLLLHCFFLPAVALVHAFTGPNSSSSSPSSSRRAVVVVVGGASIAAGRQPQRPTTYLCSASSKDEQQPSPKTFREGEVLGLRLMQSGKHEEALKGEFIAVC